MKTLRVWWVPQVPGVPFTFAVESAVEGKLLLDALAEYDLFQLKHRIKPDYSNAGGLSELQDGERSDWDEDKWIDWEDDEGRGIDELTLDELRRLALAQEQP
jgi:hypothetical protein